MTEQGASNLYLGQPLAGGVLGNSLSDNGMYTFLSLTDVNPDRFKSIGLMNSQLADGYIGSGPTDHSFPFFFSLTDINSSSSSSGTVVTTYYKVRGYYVAGAVYETYVTTTLPGTNPTGHSLIDLVVVSTWRV